MKRLCLFFLLIAAAGCNQSKTAKATTEVDASAISSPAGSAKLDVVNDQAIVQVTLNDTIPAMMFLDTGASGRFAIVDSFARAHNIAFDHTKFDNRDPDDNSILLLALQTPISARIGCAELPYAEFYINQERFGVNCDGFFAPDFKNDKRVWELNFEHNYAFIHPRDTIPQGALAFPLELVDRAGVNFLVRMPMTLVGARGDTLHLDKRYILDTGTSPVVAFFARAAVLLNGFSGYRPSESDKFVANEVRVDDVVISGGRFGFWRGAPEQMFPEDVVGTLGMGVLKHFNVFLDPKNERLYLQKHTPAPSPAPSPSPSPSPSPALSP
jgi:hypothetical protein